MLGFKLGFVSAVLVLVSAVAAPSAAASDVEFKFEGATGRYMDRINVLERRREAEFRREVPSRGGTDILALRARTGGTPFMNEQLFPNSQDIGLDSLMQVLAEKHRPQNGNTLVFTVKRMSVQGGALAIFNAVGVFMRGEVEEYSPSGDLLRKEKVALFRPYQQTGVALPYQGPDYVVPPRHFGTPILTLGGLWVMKALSKLYPETRFPHIHRVL